MKGFLGRTCNHEGSSAPLEPWELLGIFLSIDAARQTNQPPSPFQRTTLVSAAAHLTTDSAMAAPATAIRGGSRCVS